MHLRLPATLGTVPVPPDFLDSLAGIHRVRAALKRKKAKDEPLNMLCKGMGHADIKTTAIYANAIGAEEQDIAARMWHERRAGPIAAVS